MNTLYIIPARAGSKRIPNKNTKVLAGKALISYSIESAIANMDESDFLCISSDDEQAIKIAEDMGVHVHFKRPAHLASDNSGTRDVLLHALDFYEKEFGKSFNTVMLLQPTSPFRISADFNAIKTSYTPECEMAVTVCESKENPYFTLFEENKQGFLKPSKESSFIRSQDAPKVYAYNGSIYLINVAALRSKNLNEFTRIIKVVMPEERSIDLDTPLDWKFAELLAAEKTK